MDCLDINESVIIEYSTKPALPTAPRHGHIWHLFGAVHVNYKCANFDVYHPFYDASHVGLTGNAESFIREEFSEL